MVLFDKTTEFSDKESDEMEKLEYLEGSGYGETTI